MTGIHWFRAGAILAALGVIAGAFGAHYLKQRLQIEPRQLESFETGVRYQIYHAMALLTVGLLAITGRGAPAPLNLAGWLFLVGTVLFSGSIYMLALGVGPSKVLGPITPLGGLSLIVAWFTLALAVRNQAP